MVLVEKSTQSGEIGTCIAEKSLKGQTGASGHQGTEKGTFRHIVNFPTLGPGPKRALSTPFDPLMETMCLTVSILSKRLLVELTTLGV